MGQILDRIKNLVSTEINSNKLSNYDENRMKDLEQIIKELNSTSSNSQFNNQMNDENNKFDLKNNKITSESQALKILELPDDADIEMIKSAYKKKMLEYHPDRVSNLGRELQILAEMKTKEINEAYEFLKKSKNIE